MWGDVGVDFYIIVIKKRRELNIYIFFLKKRTLLLCWTRGWFSIFNSGVTTTMGQGSIRPCSLENEYLDKLICLGPIKIWVNFGLRYFA